MQRSVWKNPMARTATYSFTYNDLAFGDGLVAGSGYSNYHKFRLNSVYDPDETGVGIQPYGYDQLMGANGTGLFNVYKVFASKITVYFQRLVNNSDQSTNTTSALRLCIFPFVGTPSFIEFNDIARIPGARTNLIRTSDSTEKQKTSNYFKSKQLYPIGVNPQDMTAAYNANPTATMRWYVAWDGSATLTTDSTVNYDVKIKYYTKCWKQDDLNES